MDRWVAPTSRGIDRAFAAAQKAGLGTGGYANTMVRAVRGASLPELGRIGGLGGLATSSSFGSDDTDPMARLGGDRFQRNWGEPIADRFAATDNALAAKFDFWNASAPGNLFGGGEQTAPTGQQPGGYGQAAPVGGKWAPIDRWNPEINAAAQKWGVDPNRLKAHMFIETGGTGDPNSKQTNPTYGDTYGLMQINPQFWDATLRANGIDMWTPAGNIEAAAYILSSQAAAYGGNWDMASSSFFLGNPYWGAQGGVQADSVNGTTGARYRDTLNGYIQELSGAGGMTPNQQFRNSFGGGSASQVVNVATSFVGRVPYVWGGVPGKGDSPTGWDCSGFTYWLNQNYGDGSLPMGSHYQYAQMQQQGNLHSLNTAQPGDLLFFDTGWMGGSGAEMNRAGHVGMYIGNGQMVHAANQNDGTIISNVSDYASGFLGASTMSWSGGGSYGQNAVGYGQPATYPYANAGSYLASLFANR